ncbi:MAG: chondroitinase family polysaccharide lyase [Bacteroidales bacterium]
MNNRTLSIAVIAFAVCNIFTNRLCAQLNSASENSAQLSFEDGRRHFKATPAASLAINNQHSKHGRHCLSFAWTKDSASISLKRNIQWATRSNDTLAYTFIYWLYSLEKQSDVVLRFEFLKDSTVCAWFDYGLDFVGWREAWIAFDRDMQGLPKADMDELRITVLGSSEGRLFFDLMIPSSLQDLRQRTSDTQILKVGAAQQRLANLPDSTVSLPINSEDSSVLKKIEGRLSQLLLDKGRQIDLDSLQQRIIHEIGIVRNSDGTFRGHPVFFLPWANTYFANDTGAFANTVISLADCNWLLLNIARVHRLSRSKIERERAQLIFMRLARYIFEQGFVGGAPFPAISHDVMIDFYAACFLMKEPLRKAGLMEEAQRAVDWFSALAEVHNTDVLSGVPMGRLISLLMLDDAHKKINAIQSFAQKFNDGLLQSPTLVAKFMQDRNVCIYNGITSEPSRLRNLVEVVYILAQTNCGVADQVHRQLKKTLLTMRYAQISQRVDAQLFALLAQSGSPDNKHEIDEDLAAAYLRLIGNAKSNKVARLFADKGIKPESNLEGNLALPYTNTMIQRRGAWLAVVHGYSAYLKKVQNDQMLAFPQYDLMYGDLQISHNDTSLSFLQSVTLSTQSLESLNLYEQGSDVSVSKDNFPLQKTTTGVVSFEGRNGAYAMNFSVRKSYFFFDNRIVCLGTNIKGDTPMGTNIFQDLVPKNAEIIVDKTRVNSTPFEWSKNGSTYLIDAHRNAYFVRNAVVSVNRTPQSLLSLDTASVTETDYVRASVLHDNTLNKGTYEYAILIQPNDKDLNSWIGMAGKKKSSHYTVIKQDTQVHIVHDKVSDITAYAIFDAGKLKSRKLLLQEASLPCMAMIQNSGKNKVKLSYAHFNIQPYDDGASNESKKTTSQIILKGKWNLESSVDFCKVIAINGGKTILEIVSQYGVSQEFTLVKQ